MSKASAQLEVLGVHKRYGRAKTGVPVLQGVDLQVHVGELLAIIGRSGAGKSTLLHVLGGLDRPNQGEVRFQGENLYHKSDRQQAQIRHQNFGFVFQFYHLVPELTALENVMLPGRIRRGLWLRNELETAAKEHLERVGLSHRMTHRPNQLSGGEQQRVAIARALINRPEIVFCDEPTGNLDSTSGQEVMDLLVGLNQEEKTTLVMVTHDRTVETIAQRVLSLEDGKIWE